MNLTHHQGYDLSVNVGDDRHIDGDVYELAGTNFDNEEIFRVTGSWQPNHVKFPPVAGLPSGVFRYALIRTRGALTEPILKGVLTIIPSVS